MIVGAEAAQEHGKNHSPWNCPSELIIPVPPLANHVTSINILNLGLCFLICKMKMAIIEPASLSEL